MSQRSVLLAALLLGLCVLFASSEGDKTCGLRPAADEGADVHPTDLNADGETTPEEFVEYAKVRHSRMMPNGPHPSPCLVALRRFCRIK
jgi:hypothetical protein